MKPKVLAKEQSPAGAKPTSGKEKGVRKQAEAKKKGKERVGTPPATLPDMQGVEGLLPDSIVQAISGKKRHAPEGHPARDAAGAGHPAAATIDGRADHKKKRKKPAPGDVVVSAAKAGVDILLLGDTKATGTAMPSSAALEFSKQRFAAGPTGRKRSLDMLNTRKGCKVPVAFMSRS
eukprot:jgi/Mesvir1/24632/Mv21941-RA.1